MSYPSCPEIKARPDFRPPPKMPTGQAKKGKIVSPFMENPFP